MKKFYKQTGQLLVELLIAIGLMAVFLPALLTAYVTSTQGTVQQENRVRASTLLRESEEAVRVVRENGWTSFANNGTYHPEISGSSWSLVLGNETVENLTRQIEIANVYRDANGDIVETGGQLDPSTKLITVTISWDEPSFGSVESNFYLTRYLDNLSFTETTEEDFTNGTLDGTALVNEAGGEVILGAGGAGSWCNPFESIIAEVDLPKNGVANAISAIEGRVFVGTGENASGVSFANVRVTNDDPPGVSIIDTADGYKTNDVFGENDYAYIATDTNDKELVILDLRNTPYSEIGFFNADGSANGESIYVHNNVGYLVQNSKLWSIDLSSKNGERSKLDSDGVAIAGQGGSVYVRDNYAYVAIENATHEMQIIDISNPSNLQVVGQVDVNDQSGEDVYVNDTSTRAYVVTQESGSQAEFFIVDVSSKNGDRPVIGSYEANGMSPRAVVAVPGNKVIIVGHGEDAYQVVSTEDEANPSRCGELDLGIDINGVAAVLEADGDAYSYLISTETNAELKVIEGGPGGSYATEGSFESETFDTLYSTAFNYVMPSLVIPNQTTSNFQIAVADAVGGNCDGVTFDFLGPDGTADTFYEDEAPILLDNDGSGYENPGRCFRYKIFMESLDRASTPIFEDITINYSP